MPSNGPPQPLPFRPPPPQAGQPAVAQPATAEADDGKDEKSADDEDDAEDSADDQAQPQPGQPAQPGMTGANTQDHNSRTRTSPTPGRRRPSRFWNCSAETASPGRPACLPRNRPSSSPIPLGFLSLGGQGKHDSSKFDGEIAAARLVAAGGVSMGYQCR